MKLIKSHKTRYTFHLAKREKHLLQDLLRLYPIHASTFYRLSRNGDARALKEDQQLLDDAVAEEKQKNKAQIERFLTAPHCTATPEGDFHLTLELSEIDWLLQVLNELRIGSWIALGAPDDTQGKPADLTEENASYFGVMTLCGCFQSELLTSIGG